MIVQPCVLVFGRLRLGLGWRLAMCPAWTVLPIAAGWWVSIYFSISVGSVVDVHLDMSVRHLVMSVYSVLKRWLYLRL